MSAELPSAPDSRSDLPAPWQNPWGVLARDLWAALVWLRLKAREWIRRNAQGDVRVPSFCPDALRPLFWPSLLAVGVLVLVLLLLVLLRPSPEPPMVPSAQRPIAQEQASPQQADPQLAPPQRASEQRDSEQQAAPQQASTQGAARALVEASQQPPPEALAPELPQVLATAMPQPLEPSRPAAQDQLLVALRQADRDGLIDRLERKPAAACVRLSLNVGWSALPLPQRQRLADDWLGLVRSDGWESLVLCDSQRRQLGRPAAVGSGMILLDPAAL